MYQELNIDERIVNLIEEEERNLKSIYEKIDKTEYENTLKVLNAFHKYQINEVHFTSTTGYGYNDIGRDTIEKVFADVLGSEDAIVRSQFISGTHALTVALFAYLRPNDIMLSITGTPYDTLHEVIGIKENNSSLTSFQVKYDEIELVNNDFDYEKIKSYLKENKVKLIEIQRSKGYSTRKSITIDKIKKVVEEIRKVDKDVIIMVDNCYGELVEKKEPGHIGADIVVGSLMKNLGGGIAPTGGYIAGRKDLIFMCAERLTAPGIGKDLGANFNMNNTFFKGVFMAPNAVKNALKSAVFSAYMLEKLGFNNVSPRYNEERTDIIQTLELGTEENLVKFTQAIQNSSPIDSFVATMPAPMPGYPHDEVMAAGTFTSGSTIELSADAPVVAPYTLYIQGGLTLEYSKLSILFALTNVLKK